MAGRKKGKWARRSQSEWRSLLARFDGSGMGVAAFCRREAISAASFYRWRGLLRPRLDLKVELGEGLVLHLVRS